MKISELQSQLAMNRNIIAQKENCRSVLRENVKVLKDLTKRYPHNSNFDYLCKELSACKQELKGLSHEIKIYTKLQKALKKEIAYKIQYNRAVKQIEATVELAKKEGWNNYIVMEGKDEQTN